MRGSGWLSFQGNGFRSGLGRRVERLLTLKGRAGGVGRISNPSYLARAGLKSARVVVPVLLVIVSILSTAWARTQATFEEGETQMSVWQSSWRHSLAATVLAACWATASEAPAQDPKGPQQGVTVVQKDGKEVRVEVRAVERKPGEPSKVVVTQTMEQVQTTGDMEHQRQVVHEKIRDLEARMKSLRNAEEIEAVRRQIEELLKNLPRAGGVIGPMGPEVRELLMKRVQLEKKVREIEAKIKEHPDSPEARELRAALEKVRRGDRRTYSEASRRRCAA